MVLVHRRERRLCHFCPLSLLRGQHADGSAQCEHRCGIADLPQRRRLCSPPLTLLCPRHPDLAPGHQHLVTAPARPLCSRRGSFISFRVLGFFCVFLFIFVPLFSQIKCNTNQDRPRKHRTVFPLQTQPLPRGRSGNMEPDRTPTQPRGQDGAGRLGGQLATPSRKSPHVLRRGSITGTRGSWSVAGRCSAPTAACLKSRVRATLAFPPVPGRTCGREGLAGGLLASSPPVRSHFWTSAGGR